MSVIAVNGSPHVDGNTATAIGIIAGELQLHEIDTEVVQIGQLTIKGCTACRGCAGGKGCVIADSLNDITAKMRAADGIIIGSPVYYAGINGTVKSFLDRAFFSSGSGFRLKPAAAVVAARRAGTTPALEQINRYFALAEMLVTPTVYWSGIHGRDAGEAERDLEGVSMLKQLGTNMAYLIQLQRKSSVPLPDKIDKVMFNYIR
ncbi:MAG: flavodoxin family protein [Oscillospiraceae bacterium]|jgi:multimeric flavodoxin WrbA|nr:flavodoxin family protein [Oscillospiraceae bacterium]